MPDRGIHNPATCLPTIGRMKPTASFVCALIAPLIALCAAPARAQAAPEQDGAYQKPVLASTYVAPPKPAAASAPAASPEARKARVEADSATPPGFVPRESDPIKGEPDVKYTVIDPDGTRIEELRVRGVTQKATVHPKIGPKQGYEIIMGDGSRDLSPGANTSRGATGQRVWHILSY